MASVSRNSTSGRTRPVTTSSLVSRNRHRRPVQPEYALQLPPGAVSMGVGVGPAFTEATADKIFARVSSLSIGWKNRNRNLRAITNYL